MPHPVVVGDGCASLSCGLPPSSMISSVVSAIELDLSSEAVGLCELSSKSCLDTTTGA